MTDLVLDVRCERKDKFNPGDLIFYYDRNGDEWPGRVVKKSKRSGRYLIFIDRIWISPNRGYKKAWVQPENLELQEG